MGSHWGFALNKGTVRWGKSAFRLLPLLPLRYPSAFRDVVSPPGATLEAHPPEQGSSSGCTLGHTHASTHSRKHALAQARKHRALKPVTSSHPRPSRSEFLAIHPLPSAGEKSPPHPTPNYATEAQGKSHSLPGTLAPKPGGPSGVANVSGQPTL